VDASAGVDERCAGRDGTCTSIGRAVRAVLARVLARVLAELAERIAWSSISRFHFVSDTDAKILRS
jgi:hypothetical protein